MDPISVLQSRIEQLEAKLGLASNMSDDGQQGDTVTMNLMNTSQAINNATAGFEKLPEAMQIANELNNYTDPNLVENIQQNDVHLNEVLAAEPVIKHHCHCMHRYKQASPVLESEPIQQVSQMQAAVDHMHVSASEVKTEADGVSYGVQQLAETCGTAASGASELLASVAQKVEQAEEKVFPRRRNGLD